MRVGCGHLLRLFCIFRLTYSIPTEAVVANIVVDGMYSMFALDIAIRAGNPGVRIAHVVSRVEGASRQENGVVRAVGQSRSQDLVTQTA